MGEPLAAGTAHAVSREEGERVTWRRVGKEMGEGEGEVYEWWLILSDNYKAISCSCKLTDNHVKN